MTSQVYLNMENLYNQNFEALNEEIDITYAPIAIKQDHVLQSQSLVNDYGELPFDASILDIGSEGCPLEDCHELPNSMANVKQEETSTKQNLVADSALTNEAPGVLSKKEEQRRQYNRESARRSRERKKTRVIELEATEKLFNEVKPLLLKILITDTKDIMHEAISLQKQLNDLIVKNQNAAIIFGVSTNPGFNHTGEVAGAKMKRSSSMERVDSCERLHKRQKTVEGATLEKLAKL